MRLQNSAIAQDANGATFNSGTEDLYGQGAGGTYAVGSYDYIYYDNDGMNCYQRLDQPTDYANVDGSQALAVPRRAQVARCYYC